MTATLKKISKWCSARFSCIERVIRTDISLCKFAIPSIWIPYDQYTPHKLELLHREFIRTDLIWHNVNFIIFTLFYFNSLTLEQLSFLSRIFRIFFKLLSNFNVQNKLLSSLCTIASIHFQTWSSSICKASLY